VGIDDFLDREVGGEYRELLERAKQSSAQLGRLKRAFREGDIEQAERILERLKVISEKQQNTATGLREKLLAYDVTAYLREDFHESFVTACQEEDLPITGNFPMYEVFPFRVRIYPERQLIEVDSRQLHLLRPRALCDYLKHARNQLYRERFNAVSFLDALARAYDNILALRHVSYGSVQKDLDVPLLELYQHLTPLPAQRRAYSRNMFAFDLHRLFVADAFTASDGRKLVLGAVKNQRHALLVYDNHGRHWFFGSARFMREEL